MLTPDFIVDTVMGYRKAKVLMVAASLELFTHLERWRSVTELCSAAAIKVRPAEVMLDALVSMGLLVKSNGRYRNTPLAGRFLVRGRTAYMGDNLKYQEMIWDAWSDLGGVLKRGRAKRCLERWLLERKGFTKEYLLGMRNIASAPSRQIASLLNGDSPRAMLDVGAGPGTYSLALLRKYPGLTATLLDLPGSGDIAKRIIGCHHRLARRIKFVAADYKTADLGQEAYDLILLSHITHDEGPAVNQRLIARSFEALRPGGKVLIHDFMLDDDRVQPGFAALFSVHMAVYTEAGRVYTAGEYRDWLVQAGFRKAVFHPICALAKNPSVLAVASKPRLR